ncbi:hypothetical protein GCM10010361_11550 [Streptomyces olivaceiscleroticus]|uniref:Uncharacterized protein n=1 Tax=Streptomyces olivaceiscleroticus TaxID=68245 RepID=A0ABN0ZIY9_9ACTN
MACGAGDPFVKGGQHRRARRTVGARARLATPGDDALWRYQERLVVAVEAHDVEAAAVITNESLVNATDRIRAQLASPE